MLTKGRPRAVCPNVNVVIVNHLASYALGHGLGLDPEIQDCLALMHVMHH